MDIVLKYIFYDEKIFDFDIYAGEAGYQGYLKNEERIREYVRADASRILLDYADILCYDNDGTPGDYMEWTYVSVYHIG